MRVSTIGVPGKTERVQPPRNSDIHALAVLHRIVSTHVSSPIQWLVCCSLKTSSVFVDILSSTGMRPLAITFPTGKDARKEALDRFFAGSCDVLLSVPQALIYGGLDIRAQGPVGVACTFPMRLSESSAVVGRLRGVDGSSLQPEVVFLSNRSRG